MTYATLFDLSHAGYSAWRLALWPGFFLAIFVFATIARGMIPSDKRDDRDRQQLIIGLFGSPLLFLVTVTILIGTWVEYLALRRNMESGRVRVTTGVVADLIPEKPDGHPWGESFSVNGVRFSYQTEGFTSAFQQTVGQHGPIRDSLPVRITDVNGRIVRLEADTSNRAR